MEGSDYSNENEISKEERKRRQNRERCKRYRTRKKLKNENQVTVLPSSDSSDESRSKLEEIRRKNREKSRRCRDKKRALKLQAKNISENEGPSSTDTFFIPSAEYDKNDFFHSIEKKVPKLQPTSELSDTAPPNPYVHTYSSFQENSSAHREFQKDFVENNFGYACNICDRLWFKNDLKYLPNSDTTPNIEFIRTLLSNSAILEIRICCTCLTAIKKQSIPPLSVYNGFKYPPFPESLKVFPLDFLTERLIAPRIPFVQIRRLRHAPGHHGIYGQVINVPVQENTIVKLLPRHAHDDPSISVHIKRKKIHNSSYGDDIVDKRKLKVWLQYLKDTPLYTSYGVSVDDTFLDDQNDEIKNEIVFDKDGDNDILEQIPINETLIAQQQTLMWNEDVYLRIASKEGNVPISQFDEHAEELSFPQIYLGQFRNFRDGVAVSPFMMATSELRRSDRRGVTPQHLLYMAMNIMKIRIKDSHAIAFKHVRKVSDITKERIQSEDYTQDCMQSNLAFLRSIPNSAYYWAERKRDLFAMIRQYGKPTIFFTISANEIGWPKLIQLLHNLKNNAEISVEEASSLRSIEKSTLINEDAVTCAIYFNKLINVLLKILQSKRYSPFKRFRILHYFKRIEFQHCGSPTARILAWLADAPEDALGKDYEEAIDLIDFLMSVSATDASGNIKFQAHKHSYTCYKGASKIQQKCKFEAPFMPFKTTMILTPMKETEDGFKVYKTKYHVIRKNLEQNIYHDFETFYSENDIASDEEYIQIVRAGICRPRVFLTREPREKWYNAYNPFILNIVRSSTDFQFIHDEYSCAAFIVEYINNTDRGISNLQRRIIEVMDEHPEFNIFDIAKNISTNLLNYTEISSQEAAWYLLREPLSKSSSNIVFIPTVRPIERQRIKKTMKELSEIEDNTDIWKENWFDKYEKRPENLENVSLAQFVSKYHKNHTGEYVQREDPRVIRYRNYDMATDYNEFKREMVTLHVPFRHEETEILAEDRYHELYKENQGLIVERRKEFESNFDIQKILEICRVMPRICT